MVEKLVFNSIIPVHSIKQSNLTVLKNMLKLPLSKNLKSQRAPKKKIAWASSYTFLTNEWLPTHAALKSFYKP